MAKKKKQKNAIRNSGQTVNASLTAIDYDKLANCIAKAMAEENEKRVSSFSATREWMKFIITPMFWIISVLMAFLTIVFFIMTFTCFEKASDSLNIGEFIKTLVFFALAFISSGIALFSFFAGKEFDKEKDRQFVVAVFSGMVSLAALIVALVALVMGVR